MITPRFKLSQDSNTVTINIRAPYCSLNELDVDVEGSVFLFVCKPYYLRLTFPGQIVDDNRTKSNFDSNTGEFSFTIPKQCYGEHFKDLDLVTKFLTSKVDAVYSQGTIPIEVISENTNEEVKPLESSQFLDYGFGFALSGHESFMQMTSEFDDIFELDPCKVSLKERRRLRLQYEQGKFNDEHYVADLTEGKEICKLIAQNCPFENAKQNSDFNFTDKEVDFLKDLPNIQYELCSERLSYCHNGLVDILFAYCFDQRASYFEGSIESGWNITKLSSTLCWHEAFDNPKDALISAFRRCLIYPLHRNFELVQTVLKDLKTLINLEEKYVIKVLLRIYNIFLNGDAGRYILNNLFIKDYIIYVMKWDADLWRSVVMYVTDLDITKEDLGLNLLEIEEHFSLQPNFYALNIDDDDSDSDDNSYDSSSEETDDSSSSDYSSDSETDSEYSEPCNATNVACS